MGERTRRDVISESDARVPCGRQREHQGFVCRPRVHHPGGVHHSAHCAFIHPSASASIGGLFTSNRVDPRLAEKMVQRRMELEAKFIADAEKEKQARKLKQIEKENRQQEEREQGKAMFENSSSTKGRKLGGAPGGDEGLSSYKPSGIQRRGGG